ncbi:hypothetical protein RB653_009105 [Dictyostelium firmibasis]|uniref:Uncharacterized protein n=1 Tax=Dictyostelium firmibasis TaxID=79012 RepID=A0AAN7TTU8_9MYCE
MLFETLKNLSQQNGNNQFLDSNDQAFGSPSMSSSFNNQSMPFGSPSSSSAMSSSYKGNSVASTKSTSNAFFSRPFYSE